jgi:hypothetical protein
LCNGTFTISSFFYIISERIIIMKKKEIEGGMAEEKSEDEISLIDLFAVLLKYKRMIISVTCIAALFVFLYALFSLLLPPDKSYMPNKYTSSAYMLINDSSSAGGSLSSALAASGLSSVASLAGVNASAGSTYSSLAVFLGTSDKFFDSLTDKFDLLARYKIKKFPYESCRKALKNTFSCDYDEKTGILTMSFTDRDPAFAKSVVDYAVAWMQGRFDELGIDKNKITKANLEKNIASTYDEILKLQKQSRGIEQSVSRGGTAWSLPSVTTDSAKVQMELQAKEQVYTQLKTQYDLLQIQMASEQPVFQVIQPASVPEMKSKPSRGKLCIIVIFAAFFLSIFLALVLNAINNIKGNPEAMAKLGKKTKGPTA